MVSLGSYLFDIMKYIPVGPPSNSEKYELFHTFRPKHGPHMVSTIQLFSKNTTHVRHIAAKIL